MGYIPEYPYNYTQTYIQCYILIIVPRKFLKESISDTLLYHVNTSSEACHTQNSEISRIDILSLYMFPYGMAILPPTALSHTF